MDTLEHTPTENAAQTAIQQGKAEADGSAPVVAVEDLHKSFGSQKVLNGVSLAVKRGETLAVLGRSGTGKSVLLRIIIGLEKPDTGSVRIHGQDIAGMALDQLGAIRTKMGFLFQHAALYDSLTVEDFVRILTEPDASLTAQYRALLGTEQLSVEFTGDGVRRIAEIAHQVNERTENIGARRLHTVMERLLESVSFEASGRDATSLRVDAAYVDQHLGALAKDEDLSRYIL